MPLRHDGSGGTRSARAPASMRVERSSHMVLSDAASRRACALGLFLECARAPLAAGANSFLALTRA